MAVPVNVSREWFVSEKLARVSKEARLLFIGLCAFCDENGAHRASVHRLRMEVFPNEPKLMLAKIAEWLTELCQAELVEERAASDDDDELLWMIVDWCGVVSVERCAVLDL